MFNVNHPPLMVMPVAKKNTGLLPESEGYNTHVVSDESEVYCCYKRGWTFPLAVELRNSFTDKPLLLIRDKGRVTAQGSTFLKGYAHRFVLDDGKPPSITPNTLIFPDDKHSNWLLAPDYVNVVWLQYSYISQTAEGRLSQTDSGKLLILKLEIVMDHAPRLDKKADLPDMHDISYRVSERQLLYEDWAVTNQSPMNCLDKLLNAKGLGAFHDAVTKSLAMAGCRN